MKQKRNTFTEFWRVAVYKTYNKVLKVVIIFAQHSKSLRTSCVRSKNRKAGKFHIHHTAQISQDRNCNYSHAKLTGQIFAVGKIVVGELQVNGRHAFWQQELLFVGRDELPGCISSLIDCRRDPVESEVLQAEDNSTLQKPSWGRPVDSWRGAGAWHRSWWPIVNCVYWFHCSGARRFSSKHTPFNSPFFRDYPGEPDRYQKGKTNLDFTEARDSGRQWHQLDHMQVCTSLQTDNHASTPSLSLLQAGCPSCYPTNRVKAALQSCKQY